MSELWRSITGYEGRYEVSNQGNVRWVGGPVVRLRRLVLMSAGYPSVTIKDATRARNTILVHRCVAAAFIGPIPEGYCINHLDADRTNNHVSNLEIVTLAQNNAHTVLMGRHPAGEDHVDAILSAAQVNDIRALVRGGSSMQAIGERFGVTRSCVLSIIAGRTWKQVADDGRIVVDPTLRAATPGHRGSDSPHALLTEADIPVIRQRYTDGESCKTIALDYGCKRQTISSVIQGRRWAHVA